MESKPLSELHKRFLQEYALNGGNGRRAYMAVRTGVQENTAESAASKILRLPGAQEYLKELQEDIRNNKVASLEECLEVLTNFIRDDKATSNAKLKALDMRLKTLGAFIDKKVISNDITINVDIEDGE